MDREPVATRPALREVWLAAREREDAAPVVRAEVRAGELVRDVVLPRWRGRVWGSDRDADPALDGVFVPEEQLASLEVDLELARPSQQL